MKKTLCKVAAVAVLLLVAAPASAEIVTIQSYIQADFTFTGTEAGAALGAPPGVPLPLRAQGFMSFSFDDTGGSSVAFTDASGQLPGVSPPTPVEFLPFYITPVRFDGGSMINITRDGLGRIVSGTVQDLAMPWEMVGTGSNEGLVLYGDQATTPLLFSGDLTINYDSGSPQFDLGGVLAGADPFNVYLHQTGDRANQNPGTDPLVFIGSDRFLTISAVPEPSSVLFGTAVLGMVCCRRLRASRKRVALLNA